MDSFGQLAQLTHLTELRLSSLTIDLAGQGPTQPLPSVKVLSLEFLRLCGAQPAESTFCRILSALFPNLHELEYYFPLTDFESNLGLFRNLRKIIDLFWYV